MAQIFHVFFLPLGYWTNISNDFVEYAENVEISKYANIVIDEYLIYSHLFL